MDEPILWETRGPVALITLNAPTRRNALTPRMLCELADAFERYRTDDALRAAIVTGAGGTFCAGGDLARTIPLLTGERAPEDTWDQRLLDDPTVLEASGLRDWPLHKPVIAAVTGACMAAGFELLLGTDLRIAADDAQFALPEVRRGVIPFAGSLARLPRQVGHAAAMEILLLGQPIGAARAQAIGLVNQVLPADEVLRAAWAWGDLLAGNAPLAVQACKRTVVTSSGQPLPAAYALEDEAKRVVLATEDAREGPRAFMEKRPPVFKGW